MRWLMLAAVALVGCAHGPARNAPDLREPLAISSYTDGGVTVHTFVAGRVGAHAATHIIETQRSLVVFDPQQFPKYARVIRRYADGLDKPISHVIVSHHAPDHVGGLAVFADRDTYALAATRAHLPEGLIDHTLHPGESRIGGLTVFFEAADLGPAGVSLVARVPRARTMVLQNALYHGHPSPTVGAEARLVYLEAVATEPGYHHYLAGHGRRAGPEGLVRARAALRAHSRSAGPVVGVHRP